MSKKRGGRRDLFNFFYEKAGNKSAFFILMNVRMTNGHIVELRLHLKEMDVASEETHKIYEEQRTLEAKGETRNLTNGEKNRVELLKKEQLRIHNEAWRRILENETN